MINYIELEKINLKESLLERKIALIIGAWRRIGQKVAIFLANLWEQVIILFF